MAGNRVELNGMDYVVLEVVVNMPRRFRWRVWVAHKLIRLAGVVMGCRTRLAVEGADADRDAGERARRDAEGTDRGVSQGG